MPTVSVLGETAGVVAARLGPRAVEGVSAVDWLVMTAGKDSLMVNPDERGGDASVIANQVVVLEIPVPCGVILTFL